MDIEQILAELHKFRDETLNDIKTTESVSDAHYLRGLEDGFKIAEDLLTRER